MTNHNLEYTRLKELGNSKFEIASHENDIRNWTVKNSQGRILGKVTDLLFEKETEKVLYLVLDLDSNEMHLKERKVLLPLEFAHLQENYRNVIFPGTMAAELTELPTYEKGKVSSNIEHLVLAAFINTTKVAPENINSITEDSNLDRSRPQTVVGVFEQTDNAQMAIENLLKKNFKRNQIDISSKVLDAQFGFPESDDTSLTNWFKSVFGNEDDARTYTNAAKTRCIVTVQTTSMNDAETVAQVLDNNGALDIEGSENQTKRRYNSRILDRKEAGLRWG